MRYVPAVQNLQIYVQHFDEGHHFEAQMKIADKGRSMKGNLKNQGNAIKASFI
jgi:hypothetical protein